MAFLDRLSKTATLQERNAMVQENIGLGGNEGIEKRIHFFIKRCAYVKYFLMLIHTLNSSKILYYVKGSSAWFANAKDSLFDQEWLADPSNITCKGVWEYLLAKHGDNAALLASFLPQNWDISIFTPNPEEVTINIKQELDRIRELMIRDPDIKPQERQTRGSKGRETTGETVLDIDVNIATEGADTFKGSYVSLCRIENKQGNEYGEFDDELVCTNQIEHDQSHRVGFLVFWISIYNITDIRNALEPQVGEINSVDFFYEKFISKITRLLPATIFPEGTGLNANFLNHEGLALNSIFMESSGVDRRQEKKLDIDSMRLNAMLKNKTPEEMVVFYKSILEVWETSFMVWATGGGLEMFTLLRTKGASSEVARLCVERGGWTLTPDIAVEWCAAASSGNAPGRVPGTEEANPPEKTYLSRYNYFFNDSYQYDAILNTIKKNILKYYMVDNDNMLNLIEESLVSLYRATVNNIIIDIYDKSRSLVIEGVESVNIFIVGGDAFGRYIEEGKISDIDVKLIITPTPPKNPKKGRWKKIPVIDANIKNAVINFISDILSPYIIYLNYINKFVDKPTFRIRSYDASAEASPYSLISLDCRGKIDPPDTGVTGFFLEYALLDISIMYNYQQDDYTNYIHNSSCGYDIRLPGYLVDPVNMPQTPQVRPVVSSLIQASSLPVANALFLLTELKNRYEIPASVEARFFAGKIEKDILRYITLSEIIAKNKTYIPVILSRNTMDPFLWYSMKLITKTEKVINYLGCVYTKQFDAIRLGVKNLEVDFPDRRQQRWRYVIKAKTTYNSGRFIFCDHEYLINDDNVQDLHFFVGECQSDVLRVIDPSGDAALSSELTLRERVKLFCKVLNRDNRELLDNIIGTVWPLDHVVKYLGLEPN